MKKTGLIGLGILGIFLIALVSATIYQEPWIQNQLGDQHNLTDMDVISANTFEGTDIYVTNIFGSNSWCYQESANTSTTCGGLSSGDYTNSSGWLNISLFRDENWTTYSTYNGANGTTGYFSINYTKPSNALSSSLLTIKRAVAINNYSIDSNCWGQNATEIHLRGIVINNSEGAGTNYWQCYNGSMFINTTVSQSGLLLYEEAVVWKLSSDAVLNGTLYWSKLKDYPAACPGSGAITALNDSVTCSDLWVDEAGDTMTGNLNITGDLNVTGNCTCENVYLPCYVSTHTNTSITAVEGAWLNVTFDVHDDSENARLTHTYNDATNDTFTIVDTGVYRVSYGISYLDSQASPDNIIAIRLIQNSAEIEGSVFEKDTTKQNALGTIYRNVMASLIAGDEIKLQFVSNSTSISMQTAGTYGDHPTSANINIHRIS